jgi:type VII secretion integral membrane protein EccD
VSTSTGLVRVTVAAPQRRIDIALPENLVVAEMLPVLLRHGGEELADEGVDQGGWVLRRADGAVLAPTRTLSAHRVRHGEVLHLAPGRQKWPELDYDDLVDAVASGSRRRNRIWSDAHTRQAGLAIGALAIGLGLVAIVRSDAHPEVAGRWALGQSLVLLAAAGVLSRVVGDGIAGTIAGLLALPYAFVGAAMTVADPGGWPQLPGGRFEVACAVTAVVAALAIVAVGGEDLAAFVAAGVAALFGVLGGWLCGSHGLAPYQSATVVLSAAVLLAPLFNGLAIWLARVPIPVLPRSAADLISDARQPPRPAVYSSVARADGLLTGLLTGSAVASAAALVVLARQDGVAVDWLIGLVSAGYLIRTRSYVSVRHRVPLLVVALTGTLALLVGPAMSDPNRRLVHGGLLLLAAGAIAIIVGLGYSRRHPGPYLRRGVEIVDVLLVLAVLPVAAAVLGLYGRLRGIG